MGTFSIMSQSSTKSLPLVLQVDPDQEVWSLRGRQSARRTRLSASDFVSHAELSGPVRIFGSKENAELICEIWRRRANWPDLRLQVGTPRMVSHCTEVRDVLLVGSSAPPYAPSLGGWHDFTERDYIPYALGQYTQRSPASMPPEHSNWHAIEVLLRDFAPLRILRFIRTLSVPMLGFWLAELRDPRWFVSVTEPDRVSPMDQYLGLWPANQATTLAAGSALDGAPAHVRRCWLTQRCWLPMNVEQADAGAGSLYDTKHPQNFLLRVFANPKKGAPMRALLRASQLFTRFTRAAWLDWLSAGRASYDPLFMAEQFLLPEELTAYHEYMQSGVE